MGAKKKKKSRSNKKKDKGKQQADLNPMSIIMLNVSGLNTLVKVRDDQIG